MKTPSMSVIIRERLFECIHNGEMENDDLVAEYARRNNISYQGALKRNLNAYIFGGLKFVTDNQ